MVVWQDAQRFYRFDLCLNFFFIFLQDWVRQTGRGVRAGDRM